MDGQQADSPEILRECIAYPDEGRSAIRYRLMEGELDGRPTYDIRCQAEEGWYQEVAVVLDVTSEKETAERLLADLWRGEVTPYALVETVSEWLLR